MGLNFYYHDSFSKQAARFKERFSNFENGLESFRLICQQQFSPTAPKQVIPPGKLHRKKACDGYTIWKVELVVQGFKSNQFPRLWFAVRGEDLVFLCMGTHIDGYRDNEMDQSAEKLATSFF